MSLIINGGRRDLGWTGCARRNPVEKHSAAPLQFYEWRNRKAPGQRNDSDDVKELAGEGGRPLGDVGEFTGGNRRKPSGEILNNRQKMLDLISEEMLILTNIILPELIMLTKVLIFNFDRGNNFGQAGSFDQIFNFEKGLNFGRRSWGVDFYGNPNCQPRDRDFRKRWQREFDYSSEEKKIFDQGPTIKVQMFKNLR